MDDFTVDGACWTGDQPVLQVLRRRRAEGSRPGERTDGHTVALAFEGGGMRGCVSAAMGAALDDAGFHDCFDTVYGASAGAFNAAFFVAGDSWFPLSIYYDDLTTRDFVDLTRVLRGKPVLDLDYVLDHVVGGRKPIDAAAIAASPVSLHIAVTDVTDLRTVVATGFTGWADLREALAASAWMPLATHGTATFRGRPAMDGAILTASPYELALADGATHVLSLSTRPIARPPARPSLAHRVTIAHLNRMRPGLGDGYRAALHHVWAARADLARWRRRHEGPPYVLDVAPLPGSPELRRMDIRVQAVLQTVRDSYALMRAVADGVPATEVAAGRVHAVPRFWMVTGEDGRRPHSWPEPARHEVGPRSAGVTGGPR